MSGQTKASSISAQSLGNTTAGATPKTTPVNADIIGLSDSAAGNIIKALSWANIKATLKAYFDTIYTGGLTASSTDTLTNKSISGSTNTITNLTVSALASGVLDTDLSSVSSLDDTIPSAKSVKTYADGLVAGLLDYRGVYDASVNTFPTTGGSGTAGAVLKGDMYAISVAGTLGGVAIQVGDFIIANVDTPGQTTGNWGKLNTNISYVPEDVASKDATGGYVGLTLFKINFKNAANTFTSFLTNVNTAARTYLFPDYDGTMATLAGTETFTNKRFTPRRGNTTSSATPTINTDNVDIYSLTAQAVDITSFTTNLSGTPTHGQSLIIEITGTAARAITWGSSFEASTVALPTTTVSTDMLTVGFKWNSATSKWRCLASA